MPDVNAQGTLKTVRILWGAMVIGVVTFGVIASVLVSRGDDPGNASDSYLLFVVAIVMLLTMAPGSMFVRNQIYKSHWRGDVVTPAGYFTGNIIVFAACEGVAFVGIADMLMEKRIMPTAVVVVIAFALLAVNFPTGKPMFAARLTNPCHTTGDE